MQGGAPAGQDPGQLPDPLLIRRQLTTLLYWLILAMVLWLVGRLAMAVEAW